MGTVVLVFEGYNMIKYCLELYSLNFSDRTKELVNPFTQEKTIAYFDDGFTNEEQEYIKKYLLKFGADYVDDDGFRKVVLNSDNCVMVRDFGFNSDAPMTALAIEYDVVDLDVCELLFHFMQSLKCVVRVGVNSIACADESSVEILSSRWSNISIVESGADFQTWLENNKSNID